MSNAGYSGTPLWKKLGLKPGIKLWLKDQPSDYLTLIMGAEDVETAQDLSGAQMAHAFVRTQAELQIVQQASRHFPPLDCLWVSWPKLTSALSQGLKEDHIREAALACGLVDVKVCAVDKDWSGLKLVRRKTSAKTEAHATRMGLRLANRKST